MLAENQIELNNELLSAIKAAERDISELDVYYVQDLLQQGADANTICPEGMNVLMRASMNGFSDIVQLLIEAKAKLNIQNMFGNTALMLAALKGHTESAQRLLAAGADTSLKNTQGLTALNIAVDKKHHEVGYLLLNSLPEQRFIGLTLEPKLEVFTAQYKREVSIIKIHLLETALALCGKKTSKNFGSQQLPLPILSLILENIIGPKWYQPRLKKDVDCITRQISKIKKHSALTMSYSALSAKTSVDKTVREVTHSLKTVFSSLKNKIKTGV